MEPADDPGRLSPRPHEPRPVPLPWGLGWADLDRWLPGLQRPVGAFRTHQIRGLHAAGRSQVLMIRYLDTEGLRRERTVFLKLTDPARPEAARYRRLTALGAPVAPLLGTVSTSAGDVLVLELLATIGTTAEQADDLLALTASLNGLEVGADPLFRPLPGSADFTDRLRHTLGALLPDEAEVGRWLAGYRRAGAAADDGPRALSHNELDLQQVGLTAAEDGRSRLVVIDLETMALLPRYTDVAGLLPVLAAQTGRSEHHLFRSYLGALDARTGRATEVEAAWREMLVTRVVRTFEALPWLVTAAGTTGVEAPDRAVHRLERDLAETGLGHGSS